jgi:hypothetical protein
MRASRRFLAVALVCLPNFCLSNFAAAQQSDQVVAERVLGPQWKQLSRRAGMIFAGTVLAPAPPTATTQTAAIDRVVPGKAPSIELRFQVDKAIAGVEPGQVLTIHEWAGAWSAHRPMSKGQHILIFLYPPSRLGLTSPVGGSMGQVALDPAVRTCLNMSRSLQPQRFYDTNRCRVHLRRSSMEASATEASASFNWSAPSAAPGRSKLCAGEF